MTATSNNRWILRLKTTGQTNIPTSLLEIQRISKMLKKTFDLVRHFTSEFFNESTQKVLCHVYTSINRYVAADFVISCGQQILANSRFLSRAVMQTSLLKCRHGYIYSKSLLLSELRCIASGANFTTCMYKEFQSNPQRKSYEMQHLRIIQKWNKGEHVNFPRQKTMNLNQN